MHSGRALATSGVLLAALAIFTGCQTPAQKDQLAKLQSQVDQMNTVSAQKDSLLQEVAANTKLMNDITTELASVKQRKVVKGGATPESPYVSPQAERDTILTKIKDLTKRVNATEANLRASQKKLTTLTGKSDSLESAIASFQTIIEGQKSTIAALTDQVNALQAENAQLTTDKAALVEQKTVLTSAVDSLTTRDNVVYYVIGTKQDLMTKGIVVEEGKKFLFFGSKSLQPARALNSGDFTPADRRQLTDLTLPHSDKKYKIVSRQNPAFLSNTPDGDGEFTGSLHIASVEDFWRPSKYLIVVEM